ncbi:histidine triad (HIT) family protein [Nocardioides daedukensis]|uniref:Histidine triad (HIT) family protein n=1 Tax=Nocardioides daedukensis TaxID=634462 RepID=A0A7Y9S4H4_9ACTN|nr:HIT family protein [Nocardioides daedukensis]NYG60392.1 histidine triad (HIT) family protein [Nocardioides daedukensis]
MSDCVFCRIIAGELPSSVVHEDERTIAFMDINPASHGHALVIPKTHSRDLLEVGPDDLAACTSAAQMVATRAVERLGADGVNLLNCCGVDAWQTVFHFHIHVVPRYRDDPERDRLKLPWIPEAGDPESVAAAAAALRG